LMVSRRPEDRAIRPAALPTVAEIPEQLRPGAGRRLDSVPRTCRLQPKTVGELDRDERTLLAAVDSSVGLCLNPLDGWHARPPAPYTKLDGLRRLPQPVYVSAYTSTICDGAVALQHNASQRRHGLRSPPTVVRGFAPQSALLTALAAHPWNRQRATRFFTAPAPQACAVAGPPSFTTIVWRRAPTDRCQHPDRNQERRWRWRQRLR